jgi:predicted N-formylglutamate amidohydrolase
MSTISHEPNENGTGSPAPPFYRVSGDPSCGLIVLCDHASNTVAAEFDKLGLPPSEFNRHIAYDPGAARVTEALAAKLAAPAVLSNFSRLVIDPNRGEDDPTLVMRLSDGAVVPGNIHVDAIERARRIERYHAPYHGAVAAAIDESMEAGAVPALISVHSYTPVWRGRARPWHAGILWDSDPRLPEPLIAGLATDSALVIGDNEPYSGALANDTLYRHGTRRGLAHALIEIRQDLIADEVGAIEWADRLAEIIGRLNGRQEIHEIRHFGSRTGPVDPIAAQSQSNR